MSEVKNPMDIAEHLWNLTPPMACDMMEKQSYQIGAMEAVKYMRNHPEESPVSDAVELVEYTKWVRENWIVGSNETWRRQADPRDKRTDNALVTEYKLSSTITKKQ